MKFEGREIDLGWLQKPPAPWSRIYGNGSGLDSGDFNTVFPRIRKMFVRLYYSCIMLYIYICYIKGCIANWSDDTLRNSYCTQKSYIWSYLFWTIFRHTFLVVFFKPPGVRSCFGCLFELLSFFTSPIRTTCFLSFFSNKFLESSSSINPHNIWVNSPLFIIFFAFWKHTDNSPSRAGQNPVTQDQFKDASEAMVAMSEHRRFVQANVTFCDEEIWRVFFTIFVHQLYWLVAWKIFYFSI